MKYVDEYRSGETAKGIATRIREEADPKREYRFMEFCGGHTHAKEPGSIIKFIHILFEDKDITSVLINIKGMFYFFS